jgi:2-polyprenyl-3-methyl-5-hydroxy-6-metoxy-1,4-benzoquinol methylase
MEKCKFCGGQYNYVYKLNNYEIYKCQVCGTGTSFPKPTNEELAKFYDGFLFSADSSKYQGIKESFELLLNHIGLEKNQNLKFLDIGGSGGFFAKSFQELDYGVSHYIDLDNKSCELAKGNGINNTIHGSIEDTTIELEKYDFIFARHVIEHLLEPTNFINKVDSLLNNNGVALIMFPNGKSYEYLSKPKFIIKKMLKILKENKFNPIKAIKSVTVDILHGLDPIRHIWSISEDGLVEYCHQNNLDYKIESYRLDEQLATPNYKSKSKLQLFLSKKLASINGGTHLALYIYKRD